MQIYQLNIKAYNRTGSLERILRVIRLRGGKIMAMTMKVEGEISLLSFELSDDKPEQQLTEQLIKLTDILEISVF